MKPTWDRTQDVKRFSFIVHGDTRWRRDGTAIQHEHSLVIDSMIAHIKQLQNSECPVHFVLQSGDAVVDGTQVGQWNTSFIPLINHLTTEGGVRYFLTPGNHEKTDSEAGRRNYFDAYPPSSRRQDRQGAWRCLRCTPSVTETPS